MSEIHKKYQYDGGKGGAGVAQAIINRIPPHKYYIEAFVGGGSIFRKKLPSQHSTLIDRDERVVAEWRKRCGTRSDVEVIEGDAVELLGSLVSARQPGSTFVYCDPPYMHDTRRDRNIYRCELSDAGHHRLLERLSTLPCNFALSGYRNKVYDDAAASHGWQRVDYRCKTRRGTVIESLWFNYQAPKKLHDYRYIGGSFREREAIKRRITSFKNKFLAMPETEQHATFAMLEQYRNIEA